MSTLFVKFPVRAVAEAYEAECTVQIAAMSGGAETRWCIPRQDAAGNWVIALYGPPWTYGGTVVAEPPSCAVLRAGMVVSDTPGWPMEED